MKTKSEKRVKRSYPLEIENVGDDVYILMSRGHHDVHEFMRQVREHGYNWPLGMPRHMWARTVPTRRSDMNCIYVFCEAGERGAFPCTYAWEAWGHDSYESLAVAATGGKW